MRPNAPHDPTVEPVEELSDMGSLVVMAPPPQHRIQFLDQFLGPQRHAPPGERAYLIHEPADRFLPRDRGYKLNCVNGHRKDHTKETRWLLTSNSSTSCWRTTRNQKTS